MAGREGTELQYLERYYKKEGSQLVIFYGQKHIGMHDVLWEFCQEKPHAFYLARPCSEREQQFLWAKELREDGADLKDYPAYEELLGTLENDCASKKIIVIDEFQNIVKQSKSFMPALIRFMKSQPDNRNVMIILSSASTGWVENSMIGKIGTAAYEISGFVKMKEYNL